MTLERSDLSDDDREAVEDFEADLEMANSLADRWGCTMNEAMVQLDSWGVLDSI